jgi:hypothetical protein
VTGTYYKLTNKGGVETIGVISIGNTLKEAMEKEYETYEPENFSKKMNSLPHDVPWVAYFYEDFDMVLYMPLSELQANYSKQYPLIVGVDYHMVLGEYTRWVTIEAITDTHVEFKYLTSSEGKGFHYKAESMTIEEFKSRMQYAEYNNPEPMRENCRCGGAGACIKCNPRMFY